MQLNSVARVVIGAQFGDEGKGCLVDDYAASSSTPSIVVRFNGGAQAGHTVVTPEGLRHVFSHIGSGALVGATTFLSRFFVSNPILFLKEKAMLALHGVKPVVYVDPDSPVTTPYDMLINQIAEQERGEQRHGSCGIGFGETIERNLTPHHALVVRDLMDQASLAAKLDVIRREYVPVRLQQMGLSAAYARYAEWFRSDAVWKRFIADVGCFIEAIGVVEPQAAIRERFVLFEGAQGLWLDQDRGFFPHVTRSNTGLRNVLTLAGEWGLERLMVTYVTRAYATRHGAGPLPHEVFHLPYSGIADATNTPNIYQGTLRFGWLSLDRLQQGITDDLSIAHAFPALNIRAYLAVTCLDQVGDDPIAYYRNGVFRRTTLKTFISEVVELINFHSVLLGFGAARDRVLIE